VEKPPHDCGRGQRALTAPALAGVSTPSQAAVASAVSVSAGIGAPDGVRQPGASSRAVWVALGIVYVAWGSTYLGIRVVDRTIPPFLGAGVRFMLAGALMLAARAVWLGRFPRVRVRELASLALISVLLLAIGNGGVSFAERHVPSGLTALLVASMPLWILVIRTLAGDRPRRATMGGLAVGFVGVSLLVLRGGEQQGASLGYMLLVVAAALSWALGSWLSSRLPLPDDVAAGTAIEMLIGGAVLVAVAPASGEHYAALAHASADSLIAVGYLTVFGSILAFTAYVWVLQRAPISQISTYAYVNPVVAVALGAIILGERITALTVLSGAIVVVAVALVIRSEAPRGRAP
jgi:drug/metabolite transporter (DMT)-like permease